MGYNMEDGIPEQEFDLIKKHDISLLEIRMK
jgi:hypothetical protein